MGSKDNHVKILFDSLAESYESAIVSTIFRDLAAGVFQTVQPKGYEIALDIGTGTGVLARLLAPQVAHVTGVDIAPQMIAQAQALAAQENLANLDFQEANAHSLPFPDGYFDLVVSSFGLNHTHPLKVFAEIQRVLKPEGVFAFHEWSIEHYLDSIIIDILAEYMLEEDEAPEPVLVWREFLRLPRQWDNVLQEVEDFEETLGALNFRDLQVWEDAPVLCRISVADFLTHKLAWTTRQAELAAMDDWQRADCFDALRSALQEEVATDGLLEYDPTVFRVRAIK